MTLTKSKARVKALGEVFTPPDLVAQMLDKLPADSWLPGKTFLEPSCGNGNFCAAVYARKLAAGHDPLEALSTVYGVDIMPDNVLECQERLVREAVDAGADRAQAEAVVVRNILCGDALHADWSGDWPPRFHGRPVPEFAAPKPHRAAKVQKPVRAQLPPARPSTYSPLEGLLIIADEHMPGVTLNSKRGYTALSWRGKNVCFSFSNRPDLVVFKLGSEAFHAAFEGSGAHLATVRDGKHTWPAAVFSDEDHLSQYSDSASRAFSAIASGIQGR